MRANLAKAGFLVVVAAMAMDTDAATTASADTSTPQVAKVTKVSATTPSVRAPARTKVQARNTVRIRNAGTQSAPIAWSAPTVQRNAHPEDLLPDRQDFYK